MEIVLQRRSYGWTAWFYGVGHMPEDVELPLPFTTDALLPMVAAHIRRRFPRAAVMYRDALDHVSHVGC